jgi:hypothetical protein
MSELIGSIKINSYKDNYYTIVLENGVELKGDKPFDPALIDSILEYEDRYQLNFIKKDNKECLI